MERHEVIEGNLATGHRGMIPTRHDSCLPGGQRRHVNARKEEEQEKRERVLEEERRNVSWHAKLKVCLFLEDLH